MSVRQVVTALFPALLLLPALAPAQSPGPLSPTENGDIDEVVVTGSRIVREELTASSPIAVVSGEAIAIQNPTSVEEVLRRSPQFAAAIGSQVNNGSEGAATLDLRNLGEERTLILVDGKRFVPFDAGNIVDVNMIPTSLIERVEVITGGASSTYGSDAVAGVVNFILKKDFEGIEANANYGITQEGDGETYAFDITTGGNFGGGRGNIVLNVGYTKIDSVSQADRSFSRTTLGDQLTPDGSFNTDEATTLYSSFPGDPNFGCAQFDTDGSLLGPDEICTRTFGFNEFNLFQVPQQRWTATALGSFEITDDVEFFTRASFANSQLSTTLAPAGTFFAPFRINTDNPFLAPDAQAFFAQVDANECADPVFDVDGNLTGCNQLGPFAGDGFVDVALGRRVTELGGRQSNFENTAYQIVGGLRGQFLETQRWEVFAQYGRTTRNQSFAVDVRSDRIQQGLLVDAGGGNPFCFQTDPDNPAARIRVPDCVPVNPFGAGNLTADALGYIGATLQEINSVDQIVAGGSLTGELPVVLPTAGDAAISYAAGVEYRREQGQNRPDELYASGLALGFGASSPIDAEIIVKEVFGELLVPVARDLPFARAINLEGGVRFSSYENDVQGAGQSFDNTTFKFGGDWSPVDSLRFRAMFSRAIRAPNLEEIGEPRTPAISDLALDPCEGINPLGNAALEQLCLDTGVPPSRLGTVVSIIAGQIGAFTRGDVNLDPEEADTVTLGFVYQSEALPGFTASVDYYKIEIEDGIVEPAPQSIVDGCYNLPAPDNAPFCAKLFRSPVTGGFNAGPTVGVEVSRVNAGFESAEGIDIAAGYGFAVGSGELAFNLQATYMIEQVIQDAPGLPRNDCAGLVGNRCLRPYNEWNAILTSRWTSGPLTVQVDTRLITGVEQDAIAFGDFSADDFAIDEIPTFVYWDLRGQYDINDQWTVRAGIENLFDREPPIVGAFWGGTAENSGNTFPSVYDALGRAFTLGVTARF